MTSEPTPQQTRRALARVDRGAALDVDEATVLLAARGADLERLCAAAARIRDAGLVGADRAGGRHLLAQGVHPGHAAVPRPVPLLHLRGDPGQVARDGQAPYLSPDEILDIARKGAALGCTEALFTLGDRPEDRWPEAEAWLRRSRATTRPGLLARDGDPGARGDRAAAAPQPRRDVVGGDEPPQAGLPLDGDDARDHLAPALRGEGRGPLRLARQGSRRPRPRARGRRAPLGPVHDRPAHRDRREPRGARRVDLRAAPGRAPVRQHAGSHHPELPRQGGHRDAPRRRPRPRRVPRHHRRLPSRARPQGPAPGAPNLVDLAECRALLGAGIDDWGGVSP